MYAASADVSACDETQAEEEASSTFPTPSHFRAYFALYIDFLVESMPICARSLRRHMELLPVGLVSVDGFDFCARKRAVR